MSRKSENVFRNASGALYTRGLFLETSYELSPEDRKCIYTLKDKDHQGLRSLYRLYMSCSDPTEWDFAELYLDGWYHWELLCNAEWFKSYVERWRKEKEIKLRSSALKKVREVAQSEEHKSYYEANKFLLQGGWKPKEPGSQRGRPSKEEIKAAAVEASEAQQRISTDLERLKALN